MAQESTQYGLKNNLLVTGYKEPSNNHIQLSLQGAPATPQCSPQVSLNILFFSPQIIRFHYSTKDNFDLKLPNQHLEFDAFDFKRKHYSKITEKEDHISIKYAEGEMKIFKNPLQIQIFNRQNELLDSDEPSLGFWSDGYEIRCYKQYQDLENPPLIYGLGDKTGILNRWGRRFRNEPIDALGYDSEFTDPLYKDIPFFISLDRQSKKTHGIFFDNFNKKFFDFGRERKPSPYYHFGAASGDLNYYFIHGESIKQVLSNYLELTGRPPEWPDYTYGYLASAMSYTENCHPESREGPNAPSTKLLETFSRFKENQIPATAFHLSSGYIQDKNGQRQQFIWNKDKFPEPREFVKEAREAGVELCVNLKPVLLTSHPWYKDACDLDLFINKEWIATSPSAPGNDSLVIDYWGGKGSIMDFRKKQTQSWWKSKIKESFLNNDVHGIWNDNNEYEIFEQHAAMGHEHEMSILMSKLSLEACQEAGIKAPWILSRSGYSGIQKYAQTWTGDNYSNWKALQYDIPLMTSMSLSGLIHVGDDIGGFWGGKFNENPDPELLLRWIQFGVFTPRFCIHSYKESPTEPDMYKDSHPEFFRITQSFMQLRTELLPYIKEAANKAASHGIPIMRPTFYDFPEDKNTYEQNFEYMFGDKYLIAPIFQSGSKIREIYLPGTNTTWINYWTQEKHSGGQTITLETELETIPVFKKSN